MTSPAPQWPWELPDEWLAPGDIALGARTLHAIATPGHTPGHQSVVVRGDGGAFDLLIGDAAYTPRVYSDPDLSVSGRLPPGQASDVPAWRDSLLRIQALSPDRVHFCHHTDVIHR